MQRGEFNLDGKIEFVTVNKKAADPTRLQAGMFMDRPDLWKKPSKKRRRVPPPEQHELF